MYMKKYLFHQRSQESNRELDSNFTWVNCEMLYTTERTYGFVTEKSRAEQEVLQIPELNSGFEPYYWLKGEDVTKLINNDKGVSALSGSEVPICFKADVPEQGNYRVKVIVTALEEAKDIVIFAGRRRLLAKKEKLEGGSIFTVEAVVNISDIIPRGKTAAYKDTSFDLAIIGSNIAISEVFIQQEKCPTLYIGGDSTVTDQGTAYPYKPGCSYCGWGQMLSFYVNDKISVSNHAHSGLTTLSFRSEGHYDIVMNLIKPGDYFLLQFAHNDQKLPVLTAEGGYRTELLRYIKEIREKGAKPIIVTPLARNTWKGDGSYNDLLEEYAKVCKEIGKEENIPVLDLHHYSKEFVLELGVEDAARYYFPKDYTHSNDYGGFLKAGFIAKAALEVPGLKEFIVEARISKTDRDLIWIPPTENIVPTAPADFVSGSTSARTVKFDDIQSASQQSAIQYLTENGIISDKTKKFRPHEFISRVEALDWIVKGVRFVPTEVYNDRYEDVVGHEWYAGIVETAFQNDIIPTYMIKGGKLQPLEVLKEEEFIVFCINSYKCRKQLKDDGKDLLIDTSSLWAKEEVNAARNLGIIKEDFKPQEILTRDKAAGYLKKLVDLL
jgi:lysophospholipase L1-like esterase